MSVPLFLADPVLNLRDAEVRTQISAAEVDDHAYEAAMGVHEHLLSTLQAEEFGTDADKYPELFGHIDDSDITKMAEMTESMTSDEYAEMFGGIANPIAPFTFEHPPGVAGPTLAGEPAGLSQPMEGLAFTPPQLFPDADSYGPVGHQYGPVQTNVAQWDTTAFQPPQQTSAYLPGHGAGQQARPGSPPRR